MGAEVPFDVPVLGYIAGSGTIVHAVIKSRLSGPLPDFLKDCYTTGALCGVGGGRGYRCLPVHYSPGAVHEHLPKASPCPECARRWNAHYAPDLGIARICIRCGTERSVNDFRADARTSDGIAKVCETCRLEGRAVVRAARYVVEQESYRTRLRQETHRRLEKVVQMLTCWQRQVMFEPFVCRVGHVPTPLVGQDDRGWPQAQWVCPCGMTPVDTHALTTVRLGMDLLAALPTTRFEVEIP